MTPKELALAEKESVKKTTEEEHQMSEKEYDILNKAEDVILKKIEHYGNCPQEMNDKDCYALQLLVMTEGRIRAIRNGINRDAPY